MSDRSEELRRQRDLLREHLAWFDREIAAEEGLGADFAPPPSPPALHAAEPPDDRDAEAILAEYRRPQESIATHTKLGCVLYFVVALALAVLAVVAFYFYSRVNRAH